MAQALVDHAPLPAQPREREAIQRDKHAPPVLVGHEVPLYLTFRQAAERGGSVKRGSKGLPVRLFRLNDIDNRLDAKA